MLFELNGPILWITKLSFFLLYVQAFRPMRWLRLCTYFGAALSTVLYWSLSIALFVIATPKPGDSWAEDTLKIQRVEHTAKVNIAVAITGLLIDIWLFVLPLAGIYKLQLHTSRRVELTIMFSTGLMSVCSWRRRIIIDTFVQSRCSLSSQHLLPLPTSAPCR